MTTPIENEARAIDAIEIVWRDAPFSVAASADDWPVQITLAFEENKAATAVKLLLGDDQWERFLGMKPTNRDMNELFELIAKHLGFTSAGE